MSDPQGDTGNDNQSEPTNDSTKPTRTTNKAETVPSTADAEKQTASVLKETLEEGSLNAKQIENLKSAIDLLKLSSSATAAPVQPKTKKEALEKKYEFWETQPVPKFHEAEQDESQINKPIHPPMDKSQIGQECLKLPDGFVWVSLDIDNDEDMSELYTLLYENYVEDDDNMFRFNYMPEFLRWVLKPPGWQPDWFAGVRVFKPTQPEKRGKLVGFISAIPAKIRVFDKVLETVEINFLCVHKKLRSKRMTPVLISEITRRVRLRGIFQALYTAGVVLPSPISTCRYYHRSLNPKKLINIGFSYLSKNMTISRAVKLYKLPEKTQIQGLRQFEKKDVKAVHTLITEHMKKFDLVPMFSQEEVAHWLLPLPNVVDSYVVERTNEKKKKEIVGFFSFYILPSTVMKHKTYKDLKAAYSFYNVPSEHVSINELIQDALIIAKNSDLDVFNALNQRENEAFFQELKFGCGDGNLHYYLFNWKCPAIPPEKIGVVLQ